VRLSITEQIYYRSKVKDRVKGYQGIKDKNPEEAERISQLVADQVLWLKMKEYAPEGVIYPHEVDFSKEDIDNYSGSAIYKIIEAREKAKERERFFKENQDLLEALIV
jgi:hypothetical protein